MGIEPSLFSLEVDGSPYSDFTAKIFIKQERAQISASSLRFHYITIFTIEIVWNDHNFTTLKDRIINKVASHW